MLVKNTGPKPKWFLASDQRRSKHKKVQTNAYLTWTYSTSILYIHIKIMLVQKAMLTCSGT